jgi:M6 family metalloprotease-like protein
MGSGLTFDVAAGGTVLPVGAWLRVSVTIDPAAGIRFDDVDFTLPGGRPAGLVSPSRDATFDAAHPTVMLCAGYKPGTYELVAVLRATGAKLAKMSFQVEAPRGSAVDGPPLWFEGVIEGFVRGATWGGGDEGPENIDVNPHAGEWPVAVLLIDTADHLYPTDAVSVQGLKDHWRQETFDPGAVSVSRYFREVSFYDQRPSSGVLVTGEVFGLAHLPGNWADYMNERTHVDDKTGQIVHEDVWDPNPGVLAQACFTAADDLIDYTKFKSLVIVLPPTKPGSGVWPQAWGCLAKTAEGDIDYRVLVMPNEAPFAHTTLAHELGHNLGLPDLYKPQYPPGSNDSTMRNLGNWDLMHWQGALPQMCALSRMTEGWIRPPWVKTYNFALQEPLPPVNETVSLAPLESGPPSAGMYSAIEIRLAAGHNYYVEYRAPRTGEISDQEMPIQPGAVLMTEAQLPTPGGTVPSDRPRVIFVQKDVNGDGPQMEPGQDFQDQDLTGPSADPFVVTVISVDATKAVVNIKYGPSGAPDPSIRPWPASAERQWQSPDIEVRNARNAAFPLWKNMPWVGHDNTIVASVKNSGTLAAPGVVANFYVQPYDAAGYTVGGPTYLGSDRHDIAPGQTVEFATPWIPPDDGHRCISVDIPAYSAPGTPGVPELSAGNNQAQSNYTVYISATASPASREIIPFGVNNPLSHRATVLIVPRQTHPDFRTYLDHTFVTLDPGERRVLQVMSEHLDTGKKGHVDERAKIPNHLSVAALLVDPYVYQPSVPGTTGHILDGTPQPLGGVDIDILPARACRFASFELVGGQHEYRVRGTVVTVDDGKPVPDGQVLLIEAPTSLRFPPGPRLPGVPSVPIGPTPIRPPVPPVVRGGSTYRTVPLTNGNFDAPVKTGTTVEAYYGGAPGYGDCSTNRLTVS